MPNTIVVDQSDPTHAAAVAEIISATSITWRPTASEVAKIWNTTPEHVDEVRFLVLDDAVPIAYATVGTDRYAIDPGRVRANIKVMPGYRRQGIATDLVSRVEDWLATRTIREIWVAIDLAPDGVTDSPEGEAMARKYGFEPRESRFESNFDTSTFDMAIADEAAARQRSAGVTITSMEALLGDGNWRNRDWAYELYELDSLVMADEPTEQGGEPTTFDTWRAEFLDDQNPAGFIVALTDNQFVGLSIHWIEGDGLLVAATGVHPSFRGRGIARALKLAGASYGKTTNRNLRAYNANANEHIVTLNRLLGFVRQAGQMYWRRIVNDEASSEKK
jgi:GNAT superfamily N-acetyltransferase